MSKWMKFERKCNWGGFRYHLNGAEVKAPFTAKVRFPNGYTNLHKIEILYTTHETDYDMGHSYPYTQNHWGIRVDYQGLPVNIPLDDLAVDVDSLAFEGRAQ